VRVSLNTRETSDDHRYKLRDSGSRAVICGNDDDISEVEFRFDAKAIAEMVQGGDTAPCTVDRDLEAPLRLGYTGGTTGRPKAVTLTTRGELSELSLSSWI